MNRLSVIAACIILFGCIILGVKLGKSADNEEPDSKQVRITADGWTQIRIPKGEIFDIKIKPQNGKVYKWWMVINGDFKNPILMPQKGSLRNDVKEVHCALVKRQGAKTALLGW